MENEQNTNQQLEVNEDSTTTETFTREDVDKAIQSAEDKVRTKYVKEIKELQEMINSLKPKEKNESEIELENRIAKLEQKEQEIKIKERKMEISNLLQEKGLPTQLLNIINIGVEGGELETSLEEIAKIYKENTLNNSFKPNDRTKSKEVVTKEQFSNMSYKDRLNLFNSNEELYNKLIKM